MSSNPCVIKKKVLPSLNGSYIVFYFVVFGSLGEGGGGQSSGTLLFCLILFLYVIIFVVQLHGLPSGFE